MTTLNPFSIITLAVFAGMILFVATWYYQEFAKRQSISEANYEKQYFAIQNYIQDWPVSPESYNAIFAELKRLGNMRYKNKEKTRVLTEQFLRKYTIESDDEFSISQIDCEKAQKRVRVLTEVEAV